MAVSEKREQAQARRTELLSLKDSMDVWVEKLGGWDKAGLKTDLAWIASHLMPDDDPIPTSNVQITLSIMNGAMGTPSPGALRALHLLDQTFKKSKDMQATYVKLVREAHGIPAVPEGQDWPFENKLILVEHLFADQDYQRPEDEEFIRRTMLTFDERLVGNLDVSQRAKTSFAVMDGQQRFATMKLIGKKTAWCTVYGGMSIQEEAAFFYHKNRDRKAVNYFYSFRARRISGDPVARLIYEIVETAGYQLSPSTDSDNLIGAVKSVEDVYNLPGGGWGHDVLVPTLDLMRDCWHGRPRSTDGAILRGVGRFLSTYHPDEIQEDHLRRVLTEMGPTLLIGRAKDSIEGLPGAKSDSALALIIAEVHNQGLQRHQRLDLSRIPKPRRLRQRRRF